MSRKKGVVSDRLKEEIAKELGFDDVVDWGGIPSRDAGNLVERVVEMAQNESMKDKNQRTK